MSSIDCGRSLGFLAIIFFNSCVISAVGSLTVYPMAGGPEGGASHARADLFRGQTWLLCPENSDADATARVSPRFDATGFGAPTYARLSLDTAPEIARGADDEGELGVYHDQWQALRIADLRSRLLEFTPAGLEIDTRFAT